MTYAVERIDIHIKHFLQVTEIRIPRYTGNILNRKRNKKNKDRI